MRLAPDLHVLDDAESPLSLERLEAAGYLLLAVPVELGGIGGNLEQVCDQQRRLARRAPDLARAISVHLARCGAAADRWRAGDASLRWVLDSALSGQLVTAEVLDDPLQEAWYRAVAEAV